MVITILGSGSEGNSIVLQSGNDSIMIDAGFIKDELLRRLTEAEVHLDSIRAIFLTHGHSDHVCGVADFARHIGVPVHMTENLFVAGTQGAARQKPWLNLSINEVSIFSAWDRIPVGAFQIVPVPVSHDSTSTVGLVLSSGDLKLSIATDLGGMSIGAMGAMQGADIIMLESNHDNDMLWNSQRHFLLKKRISGPTGHLSNEKCAEMLYELMTEKTSDVVLLHLSRECNTPELAAEAVRSKNPRLGVGRCRLHIASQNEDLSLNI